MIENHHHHDREIEIDPQSSDYGFDRRSFLKLAGFAFAGAVVSGCQPSRMDKAIPYLIKPEEITPGLAYWYASTCDGCSAGCGMLVKNRDGRPIKLEGNPEHPFSRGGLCAIGQASVLSLYDSHRLKNPTKVGKESSWNIVDKEIAGKLSVIKNNNGAVRFLSGTITSPTTRKMINHFLSGFSDAKLVEYDALSVSAILDAHKHTHGLRVLPRYHFEHADVIVSFDADFLGTWISPVEFTSAYKSNRNLAGAPPKMSYHVQFESRMSLTGANADTRFSISQNDIALVLAHLASNIAKRAGADTIFTTLPELPVNEKQFSNLVGKLWNARGQSLIVCGVNNLELQILTNYINHLLGNYGKTIDIAQPSYQAQGIDSDLIELMQEIESGKVAALFIHGVNPVYDLPDGNKLAEDIKRISLVVSFADRTDETSSNAHYICPPHHFLESWNDAEAVAGVVSLTQPTIPALGNTRPLMESLSSWMNAPKSVYEIIQEEWKQTYFTKQKSITTFQTFWDKAVQDGFIKYDAARTSVHQFINNSLDILRGSNAFQNNFADTITLVLYPKTALRDGRHAHNPWLQELPDPVSKVTWDNYVAIAPDAADKLGITEGDVVRITAQNFSIELPAYIQIGQNENTIAIALGYGRMGTDRFAKIGPQWLESKLTTDGLVGKNAAPFLSTQHGLLTYTVNNIRIEKTGRQHPLASTQIHHRLEVPKNVSSSGAEKKEIVQQTTFTAYGKDPSSGSFPKEKIDDMWTPFQYAGHRWGMVIDSNACTGCAACVIGCQAENNIPTVGRDEVIRNREMHWLRIDRYYEGEGDEITVSHQPMMCQHCAHAPCETVCPVLATVHSEEGLNQQIYNRCVGTRYCSNNCPYKVRHFNWFDYPHEDHLQNMVLNPDVTVRSRGVMEKCSLCVQRIQEAKIIAKSQGIEMKDGDIKTACEQSCPSQAIIFGDMNDPKSRLSQKMKDPRFYNVLYEIGVRPNVGYMTIVRNRDEEKGEQQNG